MNLLPTILTELQLPPEYLTIPKSTTSSRIINLKLLAAHGITIHNQTPKELYNKAMEQSLPRIIITYNNGTIVVNVVDATPFAHYEIDISDPNSIHHLTNAICTL